MPVVEAVRDPGRETLASLSPSGARFLDYARETPELLTIPDWRHRDLPEWVEYDAYPVHPWPLFLDEAARRAQQEIACELTRLVTEIPQKIFGGDMERMSRVYPGTEPMGLSMLLAPPTEIEDVPCRADLVHTERGFQCLELNISSRLGGWTQSFWADWLFDRPPIRHFLEREGLDARYRDTLPEFLRFTVDRAVEQGLGDSGEVHAVVLANGTFLPMIGFADRLLGGIYQEVLAARDDGLGGTLRVVKDLDNLKVRRSRLYHKGREIQVLIDHSDDDAGADFLFFRCFKAGSMLLFGGPMAQVLGGKDSLALLSTHADSDAFTSEERELIHGHLPWSRLVDRDPTTFRGEEGPTAELVLRHREHLVLKPGLGLAGEHVTIGATATPEVWSREVEAALESPGNWVAQECVRSLPYPYLSLGQEGEILDHDVVWGTFALRDRYGGTFIRLQPTEPEARVINCHQGAAEALVLEV